MTGGDRMVGRLKSRRDFIAAAKGRRAVRRAFVLQARQRGDEGPPRFGFTVSKRVAAKAVERNRIRRRLREAARLAPMGAMLDGHDYVLVGRRAALNEPFHDIAVALHQALSEAGGDAGRRGRPRAER